MQQSVSSISHYFLGILEAIHYVKSNVFISQHLFQTSIYRRRSVVDLRKFEGYCLCLKKTVVTLLRKVPIYSTKPVAIIFVCTYPILSW